MPVIYYDPRAREDDWKQRAVLHAKCRRGPQGRVRDQRESDQHAQRRNIELGVVLEDSRLATKVSDEFSGLVKAGRLVRLPV